MTLSNSFLVVLECFWKHRDNHESTGRSVSRWVMLHVRENVFSINRGSWSATLILRLTSNSVPMILWQISVKDEQFLRFHQSEAISDTALGLVEGRVFKTLMVFSGVHTVSFRSHISRSFPCAPFPSPPPPAGRGESPALAGLATVFTCSQDTEAGTAHRSSLQQWEQKP